MEMLSGGFFYTPHEGLRRNILWQAFCDLRFMKSVTTPIADPDPYHFRKRIRLIEHKIRIWIRIKLKIEK